MIRALAILAATGLSTCAVENNDEPEGPIIGSAVIEANRTACEDAGGKFGRGGLSGTLVCYTTPADAGKSCEKSTDCSTECLAQSRSCAPVTPLFGCNTILDDSGNMVDLCRD